VISIYTNDIDHRNVELYVTVEGTTLNPNTVKDDFVFRINIYQPSCADLNSDVVLEMISSPGDTIEYILSSSDPYSIYYGDNEYFETNLKDLCPSSNINYELIDVAVSDPYSATAIGMYGGDELSWYYTGVSDASYEGVTYTITTEASVTTGVGTYTLQHVVALTLIIPLCEDSFAQVNYLTTTTKEYEVEYDLMFGTVTEQ
jgi:hypothetical protein